MSSRISATWKSTRSRTSSAGLTALALGTRASWDSWANTDDASRKLKTACPDGALRRGEADSNWGERYRVQSVFGRTFGGARSEEALNGYQMEIPVLPLLSQVASLLPSVILDPQTRAKRPGTVLSHKYGLH